MRGMARYLWLSSVLTVVSAGCDDETGPAVDAAVPVDQAVPDAAPDMTPDEGPPGCVAGMCPGGQICTPEGVCADRCRPGECPPGSHCSPEGYCVDGACMADDDCPPGSYCSATGACADGCRLDGCSTGQYCEPNTRLCTACLPEEICGNGADEDCDGVPDNGCDCDEDAPCETGLGGDCALGTQVCPPSGPECVPIALGAEICDAIDNDCDGTVDEGFPEVGEICAIPDGQCAGEGRWTCTNDGAGVVCRGDNIMPRPEVCDGDDNDCDGRADEDFAELGAACSAGVGLCARDGVIACTDDGAGVACDAEAGAPASEACNGADDDCDGAIDENFADVGTPCQVGLGVCAQDGVRVCLGDNRTRCEAVAGEPGVEICDGLDNDCDGRTDEGPDADGLRESCYDGPPGTDGVGACRAGVRRCVDGAFSPCEGQQVPLPEICDGEDNDCDGRVDRGADGAPLRVACYAGPEGTEGIGQCAAGSAACAFGALGPCEGAVGPRGEICDSVDNDCNGAVDDLDEDCACEPGARRDCYGGPEGTAGVGICRRGSQVCSDDGVAWGPCAGEVLPGADACNGLDDDCDGVVDDDIAGLGELCVVGVGFCRSPGTRICGDDGVICDAVPGEPDREICNGVDDDCDGSTDENFQLGGACSQGLGACRREGFVGCTPDGETGCNAFPGFPVDELCNGIDDDCDGETDETFDLGTVCREGRGACEAQGVIVCNDDGAAVCSQQALPPQAETCNGVDDDCDRRIDEGFGVGGGCAVGQGTCARRGIVICNAAGEATCDIQPGEPSPEQCNGADDDCDGEEDEGLGDVGPCNTGLFGICGPGRIRCVPGGELACERSADPTPEACDALDNDCDGQIDEFIGDQQCGAGICARNLPRCVNGQPVACDPLLGAQPDELCNGLDDDCDGTVDEDALGDGAACFAGVGACRVDAVQRCEDGALVCPAQAGEPVDEICNALDDDCDGTPDEGVGAQLCGQGECLHAIQNCEGGVNEACDPFRGAAEEVCDTLDNDCDGVVDEDASDAGQACSRGIGACERAGRLACVGGRLSCDAQPGPPVLETCDGLDNDCDNRIDEAIPPFFCGQGLCRRPLPGCVDGVPPVCDPFAGAEAEVCNSQDDDCDGETDEGEADPGEACQAGVGACRRQGRRVCEAGVVVCSAQQGDPGVEACDAIDNDCDGRVDERLGVGSRCSEGLGICRDDGFVVCGPDGGVVCSADPGAPAPEVCNGEDDDCDGQVDEGLRDLGACDTGDRGECRAGRGICSGGVVLCVANNNVAEDVCDGLDNDCDGLTDERLGLIDCGRGLCQQFLPACQDGAPTACDPFEGAGEELCNLLDDDCDGRVDEDARNVGTACEAGVGACRREGGLACINGNLRCDAELGDPGDERCNLQDDDCDGVVDERPLETFERCTVGVGACAREPFRACVDGALVCPGEPGAPVDEICDREDNDCDGSIDEGFGVELCGVGRCQRAINTCDGGDPMPCDPLEGAIAETCNGIDDDCDGTVDEAAANTGAPCVEGLGQCRRAGEVVCVDAALRCSVEAGDPRPEVCNGVDDDCNGVADDDPVDTGDPCVNGEGVCARDGRVFCDQGALGCDAFPGAPAAEACDGIDNDCDGTTDELGTVGCGAGRCARQIPACVDGQPGACDPLVGAQDEICDGVDDDCDGAVDEGLGQSLCGVGACARLEDDCQAGQPYVCVPDEGARFETCDEQDNDCDGTVDENVEGVGVPCQRGIGACRREGTVVCAGGAVSCSVIAAAPQPEACNGLDDDCDGRIDEDAAVNPCTQGVGACRREGFTACIDGQETCDLGAREAGPEVCNGIDDDCDGRPDEGEPDCDNNFIEDSCDIARGFSADCNGNGIPDTCDINAGVAEDCNVNGVPDVCDGGCNADETPPVVTLLLQERIVNPGAAVRITVDAADDVGVVQCQLFMDGAAVALDAQCSAIIVANDPGFVNLLGAARDAAGNQGFAADAVRVLDPADDAAPVAEITAPAPGAQISEATAISGTASDPNLTFWRTSWGPAAQPDRTPIAEGSDPVVDGPLGIIDAGSIPLGDWVLRLRVEDINRRSAIVDVPFSITGCDFAPDVCNGADDDCNGVVDEDFPEVGQPCAVGEGECRREGVVACAFDGLSTRCVAQAGNANPERCDAVDHDCDGDPTNGFSVGEACVVGTGACERAGVLECSADGAGTTCSVTPGMPQAEQCNGIDDDCDFAADEDWAVGGCGEGICARSLIRCPGEPAPVCDPFLGAEIEVCDGEDDDCDGTIDEDPDDAGADCTVGLGACARPGVETCTEGRVLCLGEAGDPADEACNDIDDDCDGLADEGDVCAAGQGMAVFDWTFEQDGQAMGAARIPLRVGWRVIIGPLRLLQTRERTLAWQVDQGCEVKPIPGPSAAVAIAGHAIPIHVTEWPAGCPVKRPDAPEPTWPGAQVSYDPAPTQSVYLHWPTDRVVAIHDRAVEPRSVPVERDAAGRIVRVQAPDAEIRYRWLAGGAVEVEVVPVKAP